jgi:DNA-binding GntR family transcriptional regulator
MKTANKSSGIYEILFNKIIHGEYAPNARLREEELADAYQVSRTPVREVLRDLEKDGLIEVLPSRETRVLGLSADDVEEVYEIRKALEILALRSSIQNLSIKGLQEIRSEVSRIAGSDDYMEHERVDARLHSFILEASNKKRLLAILRQMIRLLRRFRQLGFKNESMRAQATHDHLELIDALMFRDLAKAEEILQRHIERIKLNAIETIVTGRK